MLRCGARTRTAPSSAWPVSATELDQFVFEQRRSAELVGLDPATVPASMAGLVAYIEAMRPQLSACPEAHRALRLSFTPRLPLVLLPLNLVVPPLNALAVASLPGWARRLYGIPSPPLTDAAVTAALRAAHEATTRLPVMAPGAVEARRLIRAA
jgi:uncharacterized protein (DUF2236 family)